MLYLYEDKPYRISLGYSCKENEWDTAQGRFRKNVENYKVKNLNLRKFELKANEITDDFVRQGKRFCFEEFKNRFNGIEAAPSKTYYDFFELMIKEKEKLGKIGTMLAYQDAYNTLKKYKGGNVKFEDVDYSFLKGLEIFLYARNCSAGGIGARMRSIKAVYYEGIRRKLVTKEMNPFSTAVNKEGYSLAKLKSESKPKALDADELQKLKDFDFTQYPKLQKSYLLFMFSFRMFGMNFTDIANLKKDKLHSGRVDYARQKTNKLFNFKIADNAQAIINHFNNAGEYVFPIYNENIHITPIQKKNRVHKVLRNTNHDLREIAKILGIATPITFYVARHTMATTLKRNGVSVEVISEIMGHEDTKTTQVYLKSFDSNVFDEAMTML